MNLGDSEYESSQPSETDYNGKKVEKIETDTSYVMNT